MTFGIFGNITSPFGSVPGFSPSYACVTSGLPLFISSIVRLITVASGLWMFFNVLIAGFMYVTSNGEQEKITRAWSMIWQSILGLVIIVSSFALAGIASQLFYGNPNTILTPVIYGPGGINCGGGSSGGGQPI